MKKALLALACGAFGFSASEYTIVGVLSQTARSLDVTPAYGGHFLSAYAFGVVAGAILFILLLRKMPQKKLLLILMSAFAAGNILTALSQSYWPMLLTRFLSGLPQGGFLAVASLAAEQLAPQGKKAGAVAIMFSGMTAATLLGVPFFTFLTHLYGWRVPYIVIGLSGLLTLYFIYRWMPQLPAPENEPLKQETGFLKSSSFWLLSAGVIIGNGGVFCWLSYISPFMLKLADAPAKYMSLIMALTGLGMVLGNALSGKFSERASPIKVAAFVQGAACIILLLLFFFPFNVWVAAGLAFLCAGLMFALTVPEQMLMISAAPQGAVLGSALAQAAFYMGNSIGALGGGWPLQIGLGYRYTAMAGFILSAIGLLFLLLYMRRLKQIQ